ncbi:lasso peptide biosynthesis B2 protein [Streptomyces iconiensis]|uniref:Lasso peptide biosynthesis B2 protein n=1 Tax=Streptomyces iconiensis TaxID=1384038 RepID=A0ABT7A6J5_9ACTN|nr:lasso peptide biosynthesis B2 protein [Streptomyces iconiensis]MDJ1136926.1 lasso peptide biosynthesis B2 protein [Streptomyces iconiensis]
MTSRPAHTTESEPGPRPRRRRALARLAVGCALLLARMPPRRIRAVLALVRRGAGPAGYAETLAARNAVHAVSPTCAGPEGCLPRSLATALLCRAGRSWPVWCVGARRLPPFTAHAWVEAEEIPVGEEYPPDYFRTFFTVGPDA